MGPWSLTPKHTQIQGVIWAIHFNLKHADSSTGCKWDYGFDLKQTQVQSVNGTMDLTLKQTKKQGVNGIMDLTPQ